MPSYASPSPSPPQFGRGQASNKDPAGSLRGLLRKAFLDLEVPLAEWEEASDEGMQVLRALLNASERLRDFTAAEGQLGVLSRVPGAEDALRARLIRSMERLHQVCRVSCVYVITNSAVGWLALTRMCVQLHVVSPVFCLRVGGKRVAAQIDVCREGCHTWRE